MTRELMKFEAEAIFAARVGTGRRLPWRFTRVRGKGGVREVICKVPRRLGKIVNPIYLLNFLAHLQLCKVELQP